LAKFDFQTRVGFDFFHDLVIAGHHLTDRDAPTFGRELAQLVEVQGYELFNLENVDAFAKTGDGPAPSISGAALPRSAAAN